MIQADVRADAGQMLLVGFDGHSLPRAVERALQRGELGGTIVFARNIVDPRQVAQLNDQTTRAAAGQPPPFIAVDQEGGRVQRLKAPLTVVPPMATVGATRDVHLARRIGEVLGEELEALGFNLDFAPCIDVLTNPSNPVIGDRAFGTDPDTVATLAGALMLGLTASGLIPCAKHFPGHGDTQLDSHLDLPVVAHDRDRIDAIELAPFRRLIRAKVPMIMTAHIVVPAYDEKLPATLSRVWIAEVLRQQYGYDGVVISDDLEMKAVADRYSIEEMVELGVEAGLDVLLVCHREDLWLEAYEHLVRKSERSTRFRDRVTTAANRVRNLKVNYLRPWQIPANLEDLLGTVEHRLVVSEVLEKAARATNG